MAFFQRKPFSDGAPCPAMVRPSWFSRFSVPLAATALAALVVPFVLHGLWRSHAQAIADGDLDTRNLAKVIAAHAEQGFKSIELNLKTTDEVVRHWPTGEPPTEKQVAWLLSGRLRLNPNVRVLQVFDRNGNLKSHAGVDGVASDQGIVARNDILQLRDAPTTSLVIGLPLRLSGSGATAVPLLRRVNTEDGVFDGAMVAALDIQFLQEFYSSVDTGANGSIGIFRRDGTLLTRTPYVEKVVGANYGGSPLFQQFLPKSQTGSFQLVSTADGVSRLFSYAVVSDPGMVVVVGFDMADVLLGWHEKTIIDVIATLIFLVALTILAFALKRELRHREAVTNNLAAAKESLAENLQRLISLHAIDRAILDAESTHAIAAIGLQAVQTLVPYEWAAVIAFDFDVRRVEILSLALPEGSEFTRTATMPMEEYGIGRGDAAWHADATVIGNLAAAPRESWMLEALYLDGMRSYIRVPLLAEGSLVGVMKLGSREHDIYTESHKEQADSVASQLAIAIYQANLRKKLLQQAAELEERVLERTAQLENANRELEAFSYSISHDLRAPARHISAFASLLVEDNVALDSVHMGYLGRIQKAANRMGQLIDDLLALAKTSAVPLERELFDMSALMADVVEELMQRHSGPAVEWKIDSLGMASGDPALVRVVLLNLVSNALKYSGRIASPVVEIGRFTDGGRAFYIRDNGAGFDMKYANKLFGVFSRLHRENEFPGTGIGLATVQRIIDRHGGRVWAEGEPDRGATFFFTLEETK
ncbi:MAG: domain S-box [Betaproteobacteria bacterium]|nr:domain S-box [Betaproteobacteria bacterium]